MNPNHDVDLFLLRLRGSLRFPRLRRGVEEASDEVGFWCALSVSDKLFDVRRDESF